MARVVEKPRVEWMLAFSVVISLGHDRLHVVEERLLGHATERDKAPLVAGNERVEAHIVDKLNVAGLTVAQGGAERIEQHLA